ncbi:HAD family hydrolase [Paenibacillus koleovorans]|uniref:HAD family hydrolase n=1 Tax=Paenibacillus koleovorans TaxID=121608 RepID=UPI000FDADA1C|nr:HAD family hydrolase [Paenibacillus koleovorans]
MAKEKGKNPTGVRTVFFDMNNTMIDPERSFEQCFTNILIDFTGRWDSDDPDAVPEKAVAQYMEEWNKRKDKLQISRTGTTDKEKDKTLEVRKACLKAALKHYPFAVNDTFVQSFFRELKKQQRQHAVLFPDAAETIRELAKTYQLGIISNGSREVQEEMVRRFGLSEELPRERIFTSIKGEYRKPDSEIFKQALKETATPASQAVMVGDSWSNDIVGALKCGMQAVWVSRSAGKKITQRKVGKSKVSVIRQLKELSSLLPAPPQ